MRLRASAAQAQSKSRGAHWLSQSQPRARAPCRHRNAAGLQLALRAAEARARVARRPPRPPHNPKESNHPYPKPSPRARLAGIDAPLAFSLRYAPPELVRAWHLGLRTCVSDPATDMWALGVIAFELLTGQPAFPRGTPTSEVRDRILGVSHLPWETEAGRTRRVPELRFLRRSVAACLDREPQQRPTSAALLDSWNRLFDSHSQASTDTRV